MAVHSLQLEFNSKAYYHYPELVSVKILKPVPPNFPSWKPQRLQICLINLTACVLRLPVRAYKVKVFLTLILLSETLTKT